MGLTPSYGAECLSERFDLARNFGNPIAKITSRQMPIGNIATRPTRYADGAAFAITGNKFYE